MRFTDDVYTFLSEIRFNNYKEWFEPRKAFYNSEIYQPLVALGDALYSALADENLKLRVTRIYKDITIPPHTRYRDTFYIYLRGEALWWSQNPSLFVRLSPEGFSYGFQLTKPKPVIMEKFRNSIDRFLAVLPEGFDLGGEMYKRPKPCEDPSLQKYFLLKGIELSRSGEAPTDEISGALRQLIPVYRYFESLIDEQAEDAAAEKLELEDSMIPFEQVHLPEPDF